ncbi:MAG: hypothetical protein ACK4ND_11210 [Cytophagaceae bacterium]
MDLQNSKTKKTIAYSGIGITAGLLMLGNTYFFVDNNKLKEENQKHLYHVNSLTASNNSLERNLLTKSEEITKLTSEKSGLEGLLAETSKSLEESKARIGALVKENNALNYLKKEVVELRKLKSQYLGQIEDLHKKITSLTAELTTLRGENAQLKLKVDELQGKNGILEKKVELASIIKTESVIGEAQKHVKADKYVKVLRAKKADRLAVHFELADNKVAEKGQKDIYVRIIDPKGKVIFNDANASGVFLSKETNKTMDFTKMIKVDYSNKKQKVSIFYDPKGEDLAKGEYKLEFYSDGYFAGASKFNLK